MTVVTIVVWHHHSLIELSFSNQRSQHGRKVKVTCHPHTPLFPTTTGPFNHFLRPQDTGWAALSRCETRLERSIINNSCSIRLASRTVSTIAGNVICGLVEAFRDHCPTTTADTSAAPCADCCVPCPSAAECKQELSQAIRWVWLSSFGAGPFKVCPTFHCRYL